MDRNVFWALMAYTFALLFLYLLYLIVSPFLTSLVWGSVIGIATYPLYDGLRLRLRGKDGAASAVMTLLVLLVIVVPSAGLIAVLAEEAADAYRILESATESGRVPGIAEIAAHPVVAPWIARADRIFSAFDVDIRTDLIPAAKTTVSSLLGFASGFLKNLFLSLLNLVVMLVVLFFIYKDGRRLAGQFWAVMPLSEANKTALRENLSRVLTAGVVGILGTCLVQGFLGGIGFWIAGLPSPVLFGSLMAVAALVPFVGTALLWLPGGLYLLLAGKTAKGIFLLVWGLVAVSSADNVIRPFLIGGRAEMPVSLMALGAIGGFVAFGLMGVVVGPVLLSLFLALFEIYKGEAFPGADGGPGEGGPGGRGGGGA